VEDSAPPGFARKLERFVVLLCILLVASADRSAADPDIRITTPARLPGGAVGVAYSQTLAAADGAPPYTWTTTSGSLPPGLSLSAQGVIAGTPQTAGTYEFGIRVTDRDSDRANRGFSVVITAPPSILTTSPLASGVAASAYSQTLTASGGVPPYVWAVSAGGLPPGLTLNASSGILSGTLTTAGTFSFTARVTDNARAIASRAFNLVVSPAALPPVPAVSLLGISDTIEPAQQPTIDIALATQYPFAITGQLAFTFEPDAAAPRDDPAIQFSAGGRTAAFTIAAGATRAAFSNPQLALQTGTVAGRITLSVTLQADARNVTPSPFMTRSIRILRSAPAIRSLRVVRTDSGFELRISGFSTSRELSQAVFRFTPPPGRSLQTTDVTVPLTDSSRGWYEGTESARFGSQFTLVQPFTIRGDAGDLRSISVTLTNGSGTSDPASATF